MEVYVEKGKVIEKVGSENKSIYEYFSEDEEFMASLREDIEHILEMDDDEVRKALDSLAEIVAYMDEHNEEYGEIDVDKLRVEPRYASLYKMVQGE